ncbi:BamA/TamA family outer membrane protein [Roseateles koreensis]|uniref:BamA/TamA family outer membrane protein n=1 Tax=Roseateles koreensis TaxID=2987526 RepID=A0ABT5KQ42_9BURK|nr:BamA/TamA family outer membrane protein [Roseateles koreensis]MDC8785042.1 BamA/TamA family outer membrane protein [Roseateles koreensis]
MLILTNTNSAYAAKALAGALLMGAQAAISAAPVAATAPAAPPTEAPAADDEGFMDRQAKSPWLLVPLVSSSPKLGSSVGVLAGYVTRMDDASSPSMLAVQGTKSNTQSQVLGVGGKLYFNQNRDRLFAAVGMGNAHNDYQDFNGSGQRVVSEDKLHSAFVRYMHQVAPGWYLGAQGIRANYEVNGEDPDSQNVLDQAGIVGVTSAGLGLMVMFDDRDNVSNPRQGMVAQLHNLAYRASLGGDSDYDVVSGDVRTYHPMSPEQVLAVHAHVRLAWDAPGSRQSSVDMRGYTQGQYLGRHAVSVELEDRYMFRPQWGAKAFAGLTCLFGDGQSCDAEHLYPMGGAGVFYVIKPKENMLVSAEFAQGKSGNRGFYLRFGHPF